MNNWVKKVPAVAILVALTIALSPISAAYARAASSGTVNGHVRSAMTGSAMAGVTVRVFDMNTAEFVAEVVTSEEGVLDLSEIPFGLYQITVVAPEGYASAAGPLVSLNDDNPTATVDFNLEALAGAPPAQAGGLGALAIAAIVVGGVVAGVFIVQATQDDTP